MILVYAWPFICSLSKHITDLDSLAGCRIIVDNRASVHITHFMLHEKMLVEKY